MKRWIERGGYINRQTGRLLEMDKQRNKVAIDIDIITKEMYLQI